MKNKRVCFVEVECISPSGNKQLKRLDGLAIKGTVSRKAGTVQAEASVSVANLTKPTLEYLTTYTTPYFNPKTKKRINIYAGYEDTGWGQIFSGDIIEAIPQNMPDVWLNIKAKSLYYNQRVPISYGVGNVSMRELAQSIANELRLPLDWQSESTKNIAGFDLVGSKGDLIKEYNKLGGVIMFEDNGKLKVIDKNAQPPIGNKAKLISLHTGLIGDFEPDQYGIKGKCLIDPSMKLGDWIKTESIKLPGTNGYYRIYTLDFDFASREQQFYCKFYGRTSTNYYVQ